MNDLFKLLTPALIALVFWVGGYVMVSYDWIEVPAKCDYMKPTLRPGAYRFPRATREIERGDVVYYRVRGQPDDLFGRVLGLPGDRIAMRNGRVLVNGKKVTERYVTKVSPGDELEEIRVPGGCVWVLADNRGEVRAARYDSRLRGPIPVALIRGRLQTR